MSKMQFDTRYRPQVRKISEPGTIEKLTYSPRFDKEGRLVLEPTGRENTYEYIQSFKDSVDIHKIMERFQAGDPTALQRAQGFYADLSGVPETYADMLNLVSAGREAFDSMPAETKEKFGNSFERWLSTAGTAEWLQIMQLGDETQSKMSTPEAEPPAPEGE